MPIYRCVDKKFFKSWSRNSAYVLGFLFADGSLETNNRGSKYFSIQITDLILLRKLRNALAAEQKISKRSSGAGHKNLYRLQIGSKDMHADLLALGLSESKSQTMSFPKVPKKYLRDFVRGYFDGDGNVWVGEIHKNRECRHLAIQTTFTSASSQFLQGLQTALEGEGIRGSFTCRKTCFKVS